MFEAGDGAIVGEVVEDGLELLAGEGELLLVPMEGGEASLGFGDEVGEVEGGEAGKGVVVFLAGGGGEVEGGEDIGLVITADTFDEFGL